MALVRFGMIVDLKRCIGCYACQVACRQSNFTPRGTFWAKVLKGEFGQFPTVARENLPVLCFHCKDPPCKDACPTAATQKKENGIVFIDPKLCIGCKYCSLACPYGARAFVKEWQNYFPGENLNPYEEYAQMQWYAKHDPGTNTKCDFCSERVENGQQPACVDACPTSARIFGNLEDPESEVSQLIKKRRGFQLHPELGTDPSVYYLPRR